MGNRIVYTTESAGNPIKSSPLCKHGKDAGQACNPCDVVDLEWLDNHYTGGPGENLDFRTEEQKDAEMERWLWFGSPENPIL